MPAGSVTQGLGRSRFRTDEVQFLDRPGSVPVLVALGSGPHPEARQQRRPAMGKGLRIDWGSRVREIGPAFAESAKSADRERRFVAENYTALAEAGILGMLVPSELGGGGASHAEGCDLLRELAHY